MAKNILEREIKKNRIAEIILLQVLQSATDEFEIEDVAEDKECYHYGDIRATNDKGDIYYFDAKNDSCIHKTGRFFCEGYKYFFSNMKRHSGFMEDGLYNFLSVVDRESKKIYILDFEVLKKIYQNYRWVESVRDDAYCHGTVIPIAEAKKEKALLYTITYDGDNKEGYYAVDVKSEQKYNEIKLMQLN